MKENSNNCETVTIDSEELEATEEILNDKKMMEAIKRGLEQLERGEIYNLEDVIEDV